MTARALDTSARRTNGGCDPRRWRRRANDGDVALPLFELRDRRLPTSLVESLEAAPSDVPGTWLRR
jgi:hypothetical protein